MDEFNVHVKSCTGNGAAASLKANLKERRKMLSRKESIDERDEDYKYRRSSSGRPVRNCVKEVATYNDNFDTEVEKEVQFANSSMSGFQCTMCSSIFPTVHSRNSHMRIHKPSYQGMAPKTHPVYRARPSMPPNQILHVKRQRESENFKNFQENNDFDYNNVYIKQEPMEPEVEIHESEENETEIPQAIGNVSITPIARGAQKQKPLNPEIMRLVQNNPNITIRSTSAKAGQSSQSTPSSSNSHRNHNYNNYQANSSPNKVNPHSSQKQYNSQTNYNGPNSTYNSNQSSSRSSFNNFGTPNPNPRSNNSSSSSNYNSQGNSTNQRMPQNGNMYQRPSPQQEDPNKCYRCSSCSKPFSNKSNLYFHKKNQCGGSRYPCPFCKKRFGTEAAYSSHIFYSHPE